MKNSSIKTLLEKYFKRILEPQIKKELGFDFKLSVHSVVRKNTNWGLGHAQTYLQIYVDTDPIHGENYYKDPNNDLDWGDYIIVQVNFVLDNIMSLSTTNEPYRQIFVNKRPLTKIDENKLPFKEEKQNNHRIRTFSEKVDDGELTWHRDREDRLVTSLHKTDWLVQIDNELPQKLSESQEVFIPKGVYHRLIKGTGELKVKVKLLN